MHNKLRLPLGLRALRTLPLPHKLGVIDWLYRGRLSREGIAWVTTASGISWKLDLRNVTHRWIVYGDYAGPRFLTWARAWLRGGGIVIDSGANIGQTVQYFAPIENVTVFAFEPNPESAGWLAECLHEQPGWSVQVIPEGLSDKPQQLALRVPSWNGAHGAHGTLHASWYANEECQTVAITVDRLDRFLEQRKIPRVRLWKLDVEGWELDALRGAEHAFRRKAIDAAYVELHERNIEAATDFVRSVGYQWFTFDRRGVVRKCGTDVRGLGDLLLLPG